MASRDRDDAEGFLSRWSQRKRAVEQVSVDQAPVEQTEAPEPWDAVREEGGDHLPQLAEGDPAEGDPATVDPKDLPDIDTLEADSDFTVFMNKGVPEAVTRRALRKLWRLDPVFGHLDGLNDYDLDYTDAATVVENLKTLYQVGKGMVLPEEEDAEEENDETAAADGSDGDEGGDGGEGAATESVAATDEPQQLGDKSAESTAALPPAGTPTAEVAPQRMKPRNPGDPVVTGAATRRSSATRPPVRSARRRRWGDPDA